MTSPSSNLGKRSSDTVLPLSNKSQKKDPPSSSSSSSSSSSASKTELTALNSLQHSGEQKHATELETTSASGVTSFEGVKTFENNSSSSSSLFSSLFPSSSSSSSSSASCIELKITFSTEVSKPYSYQSTFAETTISLLPVNIKTFFKISDHCINGAYRDGREAKADAAMQRLNSAIKNLQTVLDAYKREKSKLPDDEKKKF